MRCPAPNHLLSPVGSDDQNLSASASTHVGSAPRTAAHDGSAGRPSKGKGRGGRLRAHRGRISSPVTAAHEMVHP